MLPNCKYFIKETNGIKKNSTKLQKNQESKL